MAKYSLGNSFSYFFVCLLLFGISFCGSSTVTLHGNDLKAQSRNHPLIRNNDHNYYHRSKEVYLTNNDIRRNKGIREHVDEIFHKKDDSAVTTRIVKFYVQGSNNTPERFVDDNLESRIDHLDQGIQITVSAMRLLNSDVNWIKRNMSEISRLILQGARQIVTKHYFSNKIQDLERLIDAGNRNSAFLHPEPSIIVQRAFSRHCTDVMRKGGRKSGIYRIKPEASLKPFLAYCDMESRGGGWTYVLNRVDGSQDFYLDWESYKNGFGNLEGEFWLGLQYLHELTGQEVNELLIELVDHKGEKRHAVYTAFGISSETEGYRLQVLGGYTGDAGDSLTYHAGAKFSTKDRDMDGWMEGSCAQSHGGGWWYKSCDMSNLNGRYLGPGNLPPPLRYQGMYWGGFGGPERSLQQARFLIRPRNQTATPLLLRRITGRSQDRRGEL